MLFQAGIKPERNFLNRSHQVKEFRVCRIQQVVKFNRRQRTWNTQRDRRTAFSPVITVERQLSRSILTRPVIRETAHVEGLDLIIRYIKTQQCKVVQ